tara:strand:+ start:2047 stop:3135 length:1089 start_codon:yes stop_codon:yes gene_type:complete
MLVNGKKYSSIWTENERVFIIDQTKLPHIFEVAELKSLQDYYNAIVNMQVRGAPLIGVTALFGIANQMRIDSSLRSLKNSINVLAKSRPTAVNLFWALDKIAKILFDTKKSLRREIAFNFAIEHASEDKRINKQIGENGVKLFKKILASKKKKRLNLLTHCNAGWLATVDWGTALSPIYVGSSSGMDINVFVSETRPRNQGSSLTAWELKNQKVEHKVIADNASGYLMQEGLIDAVIVGADRISSTGDVCNKIGTYLKAISCFDNKVPFFVAAPTSTIDWKENRQGRGIKIEKRDESEITSIVGKKLKGKNTLEEIILVPEETKAFNPAFDVTPNKYVSTIITEFGSYKPKEEGFKKLRNKN